MDKYKIAGLSCLLIGLSIILGAFGAHYFKSLLAAEKMESIQTANFYLMYHALALLLISLASPVQIFDRKMKLYLGLLLVGVLLFSGSIYMLVFNSLWQIELFSLFGPITPLGGLIMILSWILIALKFWKH